MVGELLNCWSPFTNNNYFIQDKLLIEGITTIEMFFLRDDLVFLELVKETKGIFENIFLSNIFMVFKGCDKRELCMDLVHKHSQICLQPIFLFFLNSLLVKLEENSF